MSISGKINALLFFAAIIGFLIFFVRSMYVYQKKNALCSVNIDGIVTDIEDSVMYRRGHKIVTVEYEFEGLKYTEKVSKIALYEVNIGDIEYIRINPKDPTMVCGAEQSALTPTFMTVLIIGIIGVLMPLCWVCFYLLGLWP